MMEHLIHSEHIHKGSRYRKLTEEIVQLKQQLNQQLDPQGKEQVDQLANAYLEQATALIEDSFIEGFCTAVDLVLDYLKRRNTHHPTADQPQPPEP